MTRPPLVPPVYLLIFAGLAALVSGTAPIIRCGFMPGFVLLVTGLPLVLGPVGLFRWKKTPVYPFANTTTLVTIGLFRFTRNPMYLGMALWVAAAALLADGISGLILVPAFISIIEQKFIRYEEMKLEKSFGQDYRDYCAKVRRWI